MAIVNIKITLDADQFNAESKKAVSGVQEFGAKADVSFDSATAKAAAFSFAFTQIAIVAGTVTAALAAPIAKFSEFETAIANVGSLGVENISGIKAGILDLSANVAVPISDLTAGMYQVVSAGVAANEQIAFLEVTSKAAKAGLAETTDAINLASAVVKGYGKEWSETESILDQAFQTVKLGQTTFPELAGSIGQTIPLASALKIQTKELFGAFATLTGVTGGTSEVATQLKAVFTGLAAPTADLTRLVKQHGFETVESAAAQQGLNGILKLLQEETGGSAAKMGELFGSVEAVNALLALAGPQYDSFKTKTDAMTNSAGEMEKAYKINSDTIAAHADILQNKLDAAQIRVIDSLQPLIVGVIDLTGALVEMDWTPFIVGASASAVALAAFNFPAVIAGVSSLTTAVATFGGVLTTATGGITLAVGALATLTVAIANSIPSEEELAKQRKKTAEETINITKAEIERVKQAEKTDGATKESTEKLKAMNDQLIMQQRIISDANLLLYSKQIDQAKDSIDDLLESAGRSETIARRLNEDFLGNFSLMAEEAAKRSNDFTKQLNSAISGAIPATERGIELLKEQKAAYENVAQILGPAALAQKNYNSEIENRKRLLEAIADRDKPDKPDKTPPPKPGVELTEIHPKEIKLPSIGIPEAEIIKAQEFEIKMVDLKFQNHLTSEEQHLNDRRALLAEQATFMADYYGAESQQALEANLRKIQFEEEYQNKRKQLISQGAMSTLSTLGSLMNNYQHTSEGMFEITRGVAKVEAIVNTYNAITKALSAYPPPLSYFMAVAQGAFGFAQVEKINAVKFERKAEGGILGDIGRQVLAADFGADNGFFIGHSKEFVVNPKSTEANLALLQLINASEGAVRLHQARQNGGVVGSSASSLSASSGAGIGVVDFDAFAERIASAIEKQNIVIKTEMDFIRYYRQTLPVYEKEEARRRLA